MRRCCSSCGYKNPVAAGFCARCGHVLSHSLIESRTLLTPIMQRWRTLKLGISHLEVRQVLGYPRFLEVIEPIELALRKKHTLVERWIYEYEVRGHVAGPVPGEMQFSLPELKLLSWLKPEWKRLTVAGEPEGIRTVVEIMAKSKEIQAPSISNEAIAVDWTQLSYAPDKSGRIA